jgi:hypothetical protein
MKKLHRSLSGAATKNQRIMRVHHAILVNDVRELLAAIVLNDREIVDVGRKIDAYRDAKMAGAVALFILGRGLAALARHYRLIAPGGVV